MNVSPTHLAHDWYPRPLPANVFIGERSWCYSAFAFLHCRSRRPLGVSIGCDSGIYNGTFFDLGPSGEVVIGNFCTLVGAIICTNGRITIGDYAMLAHEVVLADQAAAVPSNDHATVVTGESHTTIEVGRNAWIGARATLLDGARVGEGAVIGAGCVVACVVPPFAIVAGNPARIVGSTRP